MGGGRGPTGVIAEAAWLAVSLTVLVIGCAVDKTWWSLLTATCYLLALGIWALTLTEFRLGFSRLRRGGSFIFRFTRCS